MFKHEEITRDPSQRETTDCSPARLGNKQKVWRELYQRSPAHVVGPSEHTQHSRFCLKPHGVYSHHVHGKPQDTAVTY